MRGNANLKGAAITASKFKGALLTNANLIEGDFGKSDFRSALMKGAVYTGSHFKGAIYNKKSELPFSIDDAVRLGMDFAKQTGIVSWINWADKEREWPNTAMAIRQAMPDMAAEDLITLDVEDPITQSDQIMEAAIFMVPELEARYDSMIALNTKDKLQEYVNNGGIVLMLRDFRGFLKTAGLVEGKPSTVRSNQTETLTNPDHFLSKGLGATCNPPI